jgi:tRNA-2-methylthio-N6-dimethylallyladenosine synthase
MNGYDSERIAATLESAGMFSAASPDEAELVILNTCSVREKPQHKVESHVGKLRQNQINAGLPLKIGIMGCVAQQEGDNFLKRFPYVDFVLGTDNIDMLPYALNEIASGKRLSETAMYGDGKFHILPFERKDSVSAYVTIMKGCDNFCSYCVVPYVRGREKSRSQREILDEVKRAVHSGVKEIVLLGQNVNSYGKGIPDETGFAGLLRSVAETDGVCRVRFVTSHPKDFSEEIVRIMAYHPNICPCIHMPLQSGSDEILKKMNRGYTYSGYRDKIVAAKEILPDILFSSDFILGFPGETDEDFEHTFDAVREIEYEMIFAFKYSVRPGTKAELFKDNVPDEVKTARLQRLIEAQERIISKRYEKMIGAKLRVLADGVSKRGGNVYTGRTEHNRVMNFRSDSPVKQGLIVDVRLTEVKRNSLYGELNK